MLEQIFLVRHAQSSEDTRPGIRNYVSDRRISITTMGKGQVLEIVRILAPLISKHKKVKIITSPSNRAEQTMTLFCSKFPLVDFCIKTEQCIRNLNWGNVDEKSIKEVEKERYRVGVLHFQFPQGDSTPDFVRKIETFVRTLKKDGLSKEHPECVVIFTHGFALRVIVKAFLNISDEEFRLLANPPNCYVATLNHLGTGDFILKEPLPKISFDIV